MKGLILTVVALVTSVSSLFAQYNSYRGGYYMLPPLYNWEVGFQGGLSVATRPTGPAEAYQGNRTNIVHDYSVRANYYFNEHWMMGLDVGDRRWESFGTWEQPYTFGTYLQPRDVSFLIADHAISTSIQMNYVKPFYAKFNTFNRANLYFGAMLGWVNTINDNSIGYSKYGEAPDSNYKYVSSYHYANGIGWSFGIQTGFTYYIIPRLGVNLELAARYVDVGTREERYSHENARYHLIYFPETIGVRFRF